MRLENRLCQSRPISTREAIVIPCPRHRLASAEVPAASLHHKVDCRPTLPLDRLQSCSSSSSRSGYQFQDIEFAVTMKMLVWSRRGASQGDQAIKMLFLRAAACTPALVPVSSINVRGAFQGSVHVLLAAMSDASAKKRSHRFPLMCACRVHPS